MPIVKPDKCPICQGTSVTLSHENIRGLGLNIFSCASCTLEMLWPQPSWDEIKAIYQASYYQAWGMADGENQQVAAMKKATFARRIQEVQEFHKSGRLLDVGTASGFLLDVAKEQGFEPYGVEVSEYSATLAKAKFGDDRIHMGTLETAPFPDGYFNAITMTDLIEHVTSPVEVLSCAKRLLTPDGIVLMMTPRTDSFTHGLMRRRWTHYKAEHLFYFSRKSIDKLAEKAGFEVVRFQPAVKALTINYLRTQLQVYRHWLLTPTIKLAGGLLSFMGNYPLKITIGELVTVLKVKK